MKHWSRESVRLCSFIDETTMSSYMQIWLKSMPIAIWREDVYYISLLLTMPAKHVWVSIRNVCELNLVLSSMFVVPTMQRFYKGSGLHSPTVLSTLLNMRNVTKQSTVNVLL